MKRYDFSCEGCERCGADMIEADDGDYIELDDHESESEKLRTRAESAEKALEALREWALTARRLWGGGGGVHWKRFYAILDAGKPKP